MKCTHCGNEFDRGQIYCPHCGKMQQLVPDYFEAEEEILHESEHDSERKEQEERDEQYRQQRAQRAGHRRLEKKRRRRRKILIGIVIAAIVIAAIAFYAYRTVRSNSYDAQMAMAQTAYDDGNYEKAAMHANRALTLDGGSTDARLLLYRSGLETGEADVTLLTEVLDLDPVNEDAYTLLIAYYEDAGDYDAILALAEAVSDESLLVLFADVLTASPEISPEGGTYEHNTEVTITSDLTVYYTTDGSEPTTASEVYGEAILLESGTWTVTAVAVDEEGKRSLMVSASYVIDPDAPSAVSFSPSGGTYTEEIGITLSSDEGCTIYYAWDTTDQEDLTTEYTGEITIPEGNHILSAIALSEDGIYSAVSSRSYIYFPDE